MTDQAIMVATNRKAVFTKQVCGRATCLYRAAHAPRPTGESAIAVTAWRDTRNLEVDMDADGKTEELRKAERAAYNRKWRETHKEKYAAYNRAYYKAHKEKYAAYNREYYKAHKAERAAYMREWCAKEKRREERREADWEREYNIRPTREEMRMLSCRETVSLYNITRAKTKPKGVSDIRWRMELSRRRLAARERSGGGNGSLATLPHTDIIW